MENELVNKIVKNETTASFFSDTTVQAVAIEEQKWVESEVGGAKEERYQTSPVPDVHVGELLPVGRKLPGRLYG